MTAYVTTVRDARKRLAEGVRVPPLPHQHNQWSPAMEAYAEKFNEVLAQRSNDYLTAKTDDDDTYRIYSDASVEMAIARVRRNPQIVTAYHQFLAQSQTPKSIKTALLALRAVDADALLTEEHIAICAIVKDALAEWDDRQATSMTSDWEWTFEGNTRMIHELTSICFEGMSPERTAAVVMLIGRDITDPDEVRSSLDGFSGVPSALLEGVL